jgi:hypothetical protein
MECIHENDKSLVEELVLHLKGFKFESKERFVNFELQQDGDRYIVSARVQGNELAVDEMTSIQAVSKNVVSVVFNNSKVYIRAFVVRGDSKHNKSKVI